MTIGHSVSERVSNHDRFWLFICAYIHRTDFDAAFQQFLMLQLHDCITAAASVPMQEL